MINAASKEIRALLDIIHTVYSDALSPAIWSEVLSFVTEHTSAEAGAVMRYDPKTSVPTWFIGRDMSHSLFENYREHFLDREPHVAKAIARGHRVWRPTDVVTKATWDRSEVYNELLAPYGFHQFLGIALLRNDKTAMRLHFAKTDRDSPFSRSEVRLLGLLHAHLEQAFCQARFMNLSLNVKTSLVAGLDLAQNPVFVFGSKCRLLHMNRRARESCPGARGLADPVIPQVQRILVEMIERSAVRPDRIPEPMTTTRVICGTEYRLRAYPVRRNSGKPQYVVELEQVANRFQNALRGAMADWDLSPREGEVCLAIVGGMSDQEISDRLEMPDWEVAECIGRIVEKLRVSERSKIAAKLMGLG